MSFRIMGPVRCTGMTATWCPVHGDCRCAKNGEGTPTLDDPGCPLHAPGSEHAEAPAAPPDFAAALRAALSSQERQERAEAAEREAEALRRARDEREQEVLRLRWALSDTKRRTVLSGPCWCAQARLSDEEHEWFCVAARAALAARDGDALRTLAQAAVDAYRADIQGGCWSAELLEAMDHLRAALAGQTVPLPPWPRAPGTPGGGETT